MTLSWVYHIWQLNECSISKLIRVVWWLRSVFSSSSNENSPIICLDRTESNWDVEVYVQNFSLLSFVINIVECHNFLIKLEEMDFVGPYHLKFLLILIFLSSINHTDTGLLEIVRHGKLRVSVEWNVLSFRASSCCRCISIRESRTSIVIAMLFRHNHTASIIICLRRCTLVRIRRLSALLLTVYHLLKE